jgi:hypothetical protein
MRKLLIAPTWVLFVLVLLPGFFPLETRVGKVVGWIYLVGLVIYLSALATGLLRRLPAGHDINLKVFRFNFFYFLGYIIAAALLSGYLAEDPYKTYGAWIFIAVPFHLYATFYCFYFMWFLAKAIATVDAGKVVTLDGYLGILFGVFFFPIGIWWVHPKVRTIFLREASLPAGA